jgi:LytS/YehU family sensor histidine kinase
MNHSNGLRGDIKGQAPWLVSCACARHVPRSPASEPATARPAGLYAALSEIKSIEDVAQDRARLRTIIAHTYETLIMFRYWERDRLANERPERAGLRAELDALQRDVDPHFLYNSLNGLLQLIKAVPRRATASVEALAATYRYVVDTRGRPLVPLTDELAALERQHVLADIRFGEAVRLMDAVDREGTGGWSLPPLTLQELFENAIKHTTFGSIDRHRSRCGSSVTTTTS